MKWIKSFCIGVVLFWIVDSCIKEPTYSIVPYIELQDFYFKKGNLNHLPVPIPDTLIFVLRFTDGDGDLGIGSMDSASGNSYNPIYWAYDTVTYDLKSNANESALLKGRYTLFDYKAKKIPQFDTFPDINCENWQPLKSNDSPPILLDTIYLTQNLKAYNFNVDTYIKNSAGNFDLYGGGTFPTCSYNLFRGTFPDLSTDRNKAPLQGTITFRLQSYVLSKNFSGKTLRMFISINDRAYHRSNRIRKDAFTLQQITR